MKGITKGLALLNSAVTFCVEVLKTPIHPRRITCFGMIRSALHRILGRLIIHLYLLDCEIYWHSFSRSFMLSIYNTREPFEPIFTIQTLTILIICIYTFK